MAKKTHILTLSFLFIPFTFLSISLLSLTLNNHNLLCFAGYNVRPHADGQILPSNSSKTHKNPIFSKIKTFPNSSFSARAAAFFHSHPPCKLRFFITWISKLESFGQRELLSIESIFKFHPKSCLLILSSSLDSPAGAQLLKPFTSLNFRVTSITPNLSYLLHHTPAKTWLRQLQQGRLNSGEVPLAQNLSNLLRLAALYKFGGIYLDADVIVVNKFSSLRNVIGAQTADFAGNWSRLNNAVLVFDKKHPLLYEFIREFALTFDGNKWGHNGPYLVSRVAERVKGRREFEFTVAPPPAFYPATWNRIEGFFKRPADKRYAKWVEKKLKNIRRKSFAVHLWHRWSRGMEVEEGSLIERIFANSCVICNSSLSNPALNDH